MRFESINPASGQPLQSWKQLDGVGIERTLGQAASAYETWSRRSYEDKAGVLTQLALGLRREAKSLAMLATREMGKPITQSLAEVEKCAALCDYYAEHGRSYLEPELIDLPAGSGEVHYQPQGILFCIMPWNFPYWQVLRCVVPTLLLGNTVILKHAPNVIGCAQALQDLFESIGAPQGMFQHVIVNNDQAASIIRDDRIIGVALTGSERAGSAVASIAGSALKKCVLELGGSDPFIVLEDADIEKSATAAVLSRFANAGQVCIAAKRLFVDAKVASDFGEALRAKTEALTIGDPEDTSTFIGPMARGDLRDELDVQIRTSVNLGARIICGGDPGKGSGYFYTPTILTNIPAPAPLLSQETFGPAAALVKFSDVNTAIQMANSSPYGLSASIWTSNSARGKKIALDIESGNVFINSGSFSDPRLPFGGIKKSGFGRELAQYGMREFANVKSIFISNAQQS